MKNTLIPKTVYYALAIILLAGVLLNFFPQTSQAIPIEDVRNAAVKGGLNTKYDTFEKILLAFLQGVLALSFVIAVIFVVISGFRMIASRGNEEQLTAAKKSLLWAIVGIIVIALSWFIVVKVINIVTTAPAAGLDSPYKTLVSKEDV